MSDLGPFDPAPTRDDTAEQATTSGPGPRVSRRRVLGAGAAAGATGLFGAGPLPLLRRRGAAAQGRPLTFWQFYAPGGDVASQAQWFEDAVAGWNDQNDTQVELVYVPVADYLAGTKLQTAFASGEGPDIFLISPGDFLRYANGGALTDLSPFMEPAARDDFFPDVLASRVVGDKIYGLPMEVEPMAMYYDRAAWDEAGLTDGDVPQTWEQLLDAAERLQTDERFGVLFETTPGYYQNFTWYPFMWQGGAEIVLPDGKTSGLREPGAVAALAFWRDAVERGLAPRDMLGFGGGDAASNLAAGYTAMQNVGIWAVSALRENAPDFEYGVFKLPLPPNGTYTTDLGGWAFVANAQGLDPETAAQFCVWAVGAMSDDSIQRGVDWCIRAKSDMPTRQSVLDQINEEGGYDEGALQIFRDEIFPGGRGEPRVTPEIYKAISDAIQATQLGDAEPEAAAEQAAQQIESFLASYEGAPIQ